MRKLGLLPLLAALSACQSSEFNFDLRCAGMAFGQIGMVNCLRIDTRTGEANLVDPGKIPTIGKVKELKGAKTPGRHKLECGVATTTKRATMQCIRLDRVTGAVNNVDIHKIQHLTSQKKN